MKKIILIENNTKISCQQKYIYQIVIWWIKMILINLDLLEKKMDIKEELLILKEKKIGPVMKLIL